MSRIVTRSKKATRAVSVQQDEIDGATSSSAGGGEAQVTSAPPRKQARTTKTNRPKKNKENVLLGLLILPIELFTEIMHNLKPIDILNLSRTCKAFRSLLMRRSSEPIWKRAAENLAYRLPPPPPWLDMPQYVSVVYTNDCSACGGKAARKESKWDPEFQPVLLVRLCVACQPNVLIQSNEIPQYIKPLLIITIVNIFPGPGINMTSGDYGLRTEVQKITKEFKENTRRFKKDQDYMRSWLLAKKDAVESHSRLRHWDLIGYVEQDREREKDDLKRHFRRSVQKRLNELGWEHDIAHAGGKEFRSLIAQPRNLTDRIWKNLYPKLQTSLEKARSSRLAALPFLKQKALVKLWETKYHDLGTRVTVHPQHEALVLKPIVARLHPPPPEAMSWPPVKQALDSSPSYNDASSRLLEVWNEICPLVATWQSHIESHLAIRLQEDESFASHSNSNANTMIVSGQAVSGDLRVLLRADSVFQYSGNTTRYFPNDFMEVWQPPGIWVGLNVTSSLIVEGAQSFTVAREQAKALLQCLGHPNASHLSMSAYGKRFVCGICVHLKDKHTKTYDWKGLLSHYTRAQLGEPETEGTMSGPVEVKLSITTRVMHFPKIVASRGHQPVHILSVDDASKYAQHTSMLLTEKPWLSYSEKYACLHCTDGGGLDLPVVLAHVQNTHYIMEPEAHRDYENYDTFIRQSLRATYEYAS
ncbi:hypothetical protein ACGC1H_001178 [Rhizoctonia solani]